MPRSSSVITCFSITSLVLLGVATSLADDRKELSIEDIDNIRSIDKLAGTVEPLLFGASPDEILEYTQSSDDSLALFAKWSQVVAIAKADYLVQGAVNVQIPVNKKGLAEFVGFLQGRLKVQVPANWKRSLSTGRFTGDGMIIFDPMSFCPYEGPGLRNDNVGIPKTAILPFQHGHDLHVSYSKESFTVHGPLTEVIVDRSLFGDPGLQPQGVNMLVDRHRNRSIIVANTVRDVTFIGFESELSGHRDSIREPIWKVHLDLDAAAFGGYGIIWIQYAMAHDQYYMFYLHSGAAGIVAIHPDGIVKAWFATDAIRQLGTENGRARAVQ